jgi:hypothetical protein
MRTVLSMLVAVGTLAATETMAQAPISVGQNDRKFRPPSEADQASRSARAQVRDQAQRVEKRGARNARAEQRAAPLAAFDGDWSVAINTQSGACDPSYRFPIEIFNGHVVYEGQPAGRVSSNGGVSVNISQGGQQAAGQGRLSRNYGTGVWRGYGSAGTCAGTWQAQRRD